MRRYFNTEGLCDPQEHYMVRLDDRPKGTPQEICNDKNSLTGKYLKRLYGK